MPRRSRLTTGGLAYHVLNRRIGRLPLFEKPADYRAFEKILHEAHQQTAVRIAAYCLTSFVVAAKRRGVVGSYALDHSDAHPTLACSPSLSGDRASLSGTVQILSSSD